MVEESTDYLLPFIQVYSTNKNFLSSMSSIVYMLVNILEPKRIVPLHVLEF